MLEPIVVALPTLVSGAAAIFAWVRTRQDQADDVEVENAVSERFLREMGDAVAELPLEVRRRFLRDLADVRWDDDEPQRFPSLPRTPAAKADDDAVERRVSAFRERLDRIEVRFPAEATLEKVASVNDAILATRLEALQEDLRETKAKMLSKWDVATIVFAVVAAVGATVGLVAGTVRLVGG
jgi:hypothetical protein